MANEEDAKRTSESLLPPAREVLEPLIRSILRNVPGARLQTGALN